MLVFLWHIFQTWARNAHQKMKWRSGIALGVRKCASGKHSVHISIFLHFHEIRICYVYNGQRNTSISCHQTSTAFVVSVFKNRCAAAIIYGHCLRTPCENQKKMLPDMNFVFLHFSSEISGEILSESSRNPSKVILSKHIGTPSEQSGNPINIHGNPC